MEKPQPRTKSARIFLVDDHPLVRQGLTDVLQREPEFKICGEAESRLDAIEAIEATRPDLAIVDLNLRNSHGLELIKDIRARFPKVRVLVVTVQDEALHAERAIRAGASGYLTKDEATTEVVQAVRQVLRGEFVLSPSLTSQMAARLAGHPNGNGSAGNHDKLSDRELEVLELIGNGLGRQQIADRLHLDINTVETYRSRLREKLQLENAQELLQYAIRYDRARTA
jgi:DNA-binding NarL/FixJ family response regulator